MGLWHGVEHYEKMKVLEPIETEMFVKSWPPLLQQSTDFRYDWSYIVSWVGVGMTLCSSILFALAAVCIKNDKEREDAMNLQYLMPGKYIIFMDTFTTRSVKDFGDSRISSKVGAKDSSRHWP